MKQRRTNAQIADTPQNVLRNEIQFTINYQIVSFVTVRLTADKIRTRLDTICAIKHAI